MDKIILVLMCLLASACSDEIYQNSSHICDKCKCVDADEFTLDCTNKDIHYALANWPLHNKTFVATFSYNNITTLERLPITEYKAKLVFDHCNIKYLGRKVFSNVKNVEFIDLSYNLLTTEEIDGEDFKGPYNNSVYYPIAVKHLNLAYNQIHSLPRKFFENMPHLEELNLEGNDFVVLDPNTQMALSTLSKLKRLNLANNELTELVEDAIKNLHNLVEIDLSSNHLDFVPDNLDILKGNLQVLKLSDNYIFELDDKSFLGLDLIELHLNNLPRLQVIRPNTFAPLSRLSKLYLCNNSNLRAIDREAFSKGQQINELRLNNNSLFEIDEELVAWSKLKIFEMYDNPLECDCHLYKITNSLSEDITRSGNGPTCKSQPEGFTKQMYSLTNDTCEQGDPPFHIHRAAQHFNTMRAIIVTLSLILIMGTVIAAVVGFLRYRKVVAFKNYPFAAQVSYNPINNQYI